MSSAWGSAWGFCWGDSWGPLDEEQSVPRPRPAIIYVEFDRSKEKQGAITIDSATATGKAGRVTAEAGQSDSAQISAFTWAISGRIKAEGKIAVNATGIIPGVVSDTAAGLFMVVADGLTGIDAVAVNGYAGILQAAGEDLEDEMVILLMEA